jgi:hypothetical protein
MESVDCSISYMGGKENIKQEKNWHKVFRSHERKI